MGAAYRLDANERTRQTAEMLRARRAIGIARTSRRRLPRQVPPRAIEREYARELMNLVAQVQRELQPLEFELPALLERARSERVDALVRMDIGEGRRVRDLIAQVAGKLRSALRIDSIERLAQRLAGRTSEHNREQLGRQIRAALDIDILMSDRKLGALVDGFVTENVALIRDIPDQIISKIERAVTRGLQAGTLTRELQRELAGIIDDGRARARLIARDQIGKLYGRINQVRQEDMGVESYIWRTVRDERVRDDHRARDGERFQWDDPPSDGHPGQPIQCRCYPEPVFDEILNTAATKPPKYSEIPPEGVEREISGADLNLRKFTAFDRPIKATSEERLQSIRDLFRQGRQNQGRGVIVAALRDGTYEVVDGRHRLLVAPEFPNQKLKIRFERGV